MTGAPDGESSDGPLSEAIAALLHDVPDFPQPGVLFKDITPLLADGPTFGAVTAALADLARADGGIDLVAGVEARGFFFAAAAAHALGCGVVPVRKAGKLPPPTVRASYALEYGTAEIEVPVGVLAGRRVLLVDDVLATGGTLAAALDLLERAGATVAGVAVVVELAALGGRARFAGRPLHALHTVGTAAPSG
jgi:adenine phosphoribosyltransferase